VCAFRAVVGLVAWVEMECRGLRSEWEFAMGATVVLFRELKFLELGIGTGVDIGCGGVGVREGEDGESRCLKFIMTKINRTSERAVKLFGCS
jgi:hypothetical protein